ncbi:hypothetical protein [Streptomyces sp. NPDC001492]
MPDLTFSGLQAATKKLAQDVARSADAIRTEEKAINAEADGTARDAEAIAAMRVDKASVSENHELAKIMRGLSAAVIEHASAATGTARQAKAVNDQNQASHAQINEEVHRSPVGAEIYDVDRRWVMAE